MAAAIQNAAGGALLGAISSPAAADFTWQAVAAAAPRLVEIMQQRHACASAPRALHTLLHRPSLPSASGSAAIRRPATSIGASPRLFHSQIHRSAGTIAGANKPSLTMMAGSTRSFSSHDNFTNQLEEEETKMKKKKALAVALMNDIPATPAGAADHGEEIGSINHLFGLLDVHEANTPTTKDDDGQAEKMIAELRVLVGKKKNELLIELIKDGDAKEEKKAEVVDAGRRLRDALDARDKSRAFQTLYTDMKSLQQRMKESERNYGRLSDSVAASRMDVESARATANSVRTDVIRLGAEVESTKKIADSTYKNVDLLEKSVAQGRKEAESAYGLSLFVGFCGAAGVLWCAII
ncbi:unnamed protein product [Alopecurus aequalis]